MNRIWHRSACALLVFCAACGAGGNEPGSDGGSRDTGAQDAARSDARADGAIGPDGRADQDSGMSQDSGVSQDSDTLADGGTITDGGTARGDADASTRMCTAPHADCNLDAADGCEVDLRSDAANCAACGRSCGHAACTSGRCAPETLITGGLRVEDITTDADYVYWYDADPLAVGWDGQIRRIPKAGGAATTVVTGLGPGQAPLHYNGGYLFYGTTLPSNLIVMQRAAVAGGARTTLTHWTPNEGAYAVDDTNLYGLDPCINPDAICTMGADSVVRLPRVGTTGSGVLAAHRPGARVFGADGAYVYWSDVADENHATISRMPRGGGAIQVLAANQPDPRIPSLGSDGYVYWVNYCSSVTAFGAVMRVRPGMASPERLIADVGCGYQVVSDGVDLYWSGFHPSTSNVYIRHLRIGSSTSDVIVDSAAASGNLVLDATHLYYSTYTAIYRVRR